jgi:hypothetical protein
MLIAQNFSILCKCVLQIFKQQFGNALKTKALKFYQFTHKGIFAEGKYEKPPWCSSARACLLVLMWTGKSPPVGARSGSDATSSSCTCVAWLASMSSDDRSNSLISLSSSEVDPSEMESWSRSPCHEMGLLELTASMTCFSSESDVSSHSAVLCT